MKESNNNSPSKLSKSSYEGKNEELKSSSNKKYDNIHNSSDCSPQDHKYYFSEDEPNQGNDQYKSMSKNKIHCNLKMIFMSIAKYNSKEDDYFIMQQNLNKILRENQSIGKYGIPLCEVDVLYKRISAKGSKINYDQFVNLIIRLVKRLLPEEFEQDPKGTLNVFLSHFFDKFQNVINNQSSSIHGELAGTAQTHKSIEKLMQYLPDSQQKYIIFKLYVPLIEIYFAYFDPRELMSQEEYALRKFFIHNLMVFVRDFDIMPFIMNETLIGIYFALTTDISQEEENNSSIREDQEQYEERMKCKAISDDFNQGIFFTFDHFCLMLIHLSVYHHNKTAIDGDKESEVGKLLLFLEKLDSSKGMKAMHSKIYKTNITKNSLIPSKQVIEELNNYHNNLEESSSMRKRKSPLSNTISSEMNDIKEETENNETIEKNMYDLSRTFLYYSRIGNKLTFNQMSLSSYVRFLKDIKLLKELKEYKGYNESKKNNQRKEFTLEVNSTQTREKYMKNQRLKEIRQAYLKKNNYGNPMKFQDGKDRTIDTTIGDTKYINKTMDSKEKTINTSLCSQEKKNKETLNPFKKNPLYGFRNNETHSLSESDASIIFSSITGPKSNEITKKLQGKPHNSGSPSLANKLISMSNSCDFNNISETTKSNSKVYQMDFKQFILSFNYIAHKIFPEESSESGLNHLLNENIIPNLIQQDSKVLIDHNDNVQSAIEQLSFPDIRLFIESLSEIITTYYFFYCDSNKEMNFSQMFEFNKDFNIFPEMINLVYLKDIFFYFSEMNKREKDQISTMMIEKGTMSYRHFLESLAVIAFIYNYDKELTVMEKLMFIVERLIQSNGIEKCRNKSGRLEVKNHDLNGFLIRMKKEYYGYNASMTISDLNKEAQIKKDSTLCLNDFYGDSHHDK